MQKVEQTETTDDRCTNERMYRRRNHESKKTGDIETELIEVLGCWWRNDS